MHVQKSFNRFFTRFLHILIPLIAFVGPLGVIGFGYTNGAIRSMILFALTLLAWLAWLARAVFGQQTLRWQKSAIGWGCGVLLIIVIVSSFASLRPGSVWAIDGSFTSFDMYAWLSAIAFALITVQHVRGRMKRIKTILFAYLVASTVIVLGSLIWSLAVGTTVALIGSIPAQALWASLSVVLITVFSSTLNKTARLFWIGALVAHLLSLAVYDYAFAWYVLTIGVGLYAGLLMARAVPRARGARVESMGARMLPAAIALAAAITFALVPVARFTPFGFDASAAQFVPMQTGVQKMIQISTPAEVLLGYGPGLGIDAFWAGTELVDMRSVGQFPSFNSNALTLLWDGGLLAVLAALLVVLGVAFQLTRLVRTRLLRRRVDVKDGDLMLSFGLGVAFFVSLLMFVLAPATGYLLFVFLSVGALSSASLLSVLSGEKVVAVDPRYARNWQLSETSFGLPFARFILLSGIIVLVLFAAIAIWNIRGRMLFLTSVSINKNGTNINLQKLGAAIRSNPRSYVYQVARIDFYRQSITEQIKDAADAYAIDEKLLKTIAPSVAIVDNDYASLKGRELLTQAYWQLGWNAEQIGGSLFAFSTIEIPDEEEYMDGLYWLARAEAYYEDALARFPRNVILFTDVARFYRQRASIIENSETVADASESTRYRERARALTDRALAVDNTYTPARFEQSQILRASGDLEGALAAIRGSAQQDAGLAYQASTIATELGNTEETIALLKTTIDLNPNHLQARYDLTQIYISQGNTEEATAHLDELSNRVPEDDLRSRALVQALRSLIEKN